MEGRTGKGTETLPILVDQWIREEGISLGQLRDRIPDELGELSSPRSWFALIRVLLCVAVCIVLLRLIPLESGPSLIWQIPSLVVLWILYGWVLVGLFVIGHDCGHYSFSKRRWINSMVGYLCMSPLANSFHSWRVTHNHHHRFTQLRGQEVDWSVHLLTREEYESPVYSKSLVTRLGYALPFGIFLWIYWNTIRRAIQIGSMLPEDLLTRELSRLRRSGLIMVLFLLTIYGGLWHFTGFWGMLKYYGVPAGVAMLTGFLIIAIQHGTEDSVFYDESGWTPVRGQLTSTFDTRFPRLLQYMWCNINVHIPHHIAPRVPWYHLKQAAAALKSAYPTLYQEREFGLSHLTWFYRTPFLLRNEAKGYFVLDVPA